MDVDFDALFERAAELEEENEDDEKIMELCSRRGSLPAQTFQPPTEPPSTSHRRSKTVKHKGGRKPPSSSKSSRRPSVAPMGRRASEAFQTAPIPSFGSTQRLRRLSEAYHQTGDESCLTEEDEEEEDIEISRLTPIPQGEVVSSENYRRSPLPSPTFGGERACKGRSRRSGSITQLSPTETMETLKFLQTKDISTVRNFTLTAEGAVSNKGDSFRFSSNTEMSAPGRDVEVDELLEKAEELRDNHPSSVAKKIGAVPCQRVLVLGDAGVGKTSLMQQFLTSEAMGGDVADCDVEQRITVSVDGQETIMELHEGQADLQLSRDDLMDGYIVVFSMTEASTFQGACCLVKELRKTYAKKPRATILVANKGELVRSRQVTEYEGRKFASRHGCKYVEVSAVINHNTDVLLVGIVKQMRFNGQRKALKLRDNGEPSRFSCAQLSPKLSRIERIFKKKDQVYSSTENLLVM